MKTKSPKDSSAPGSVFKVGAIALAFLIIGYQSALFINRAAVLRIESLRDRPDTVYVIDESLAARLLFTSDSCMTDNFLSPVRKGQSRSEVVGPAADPESSLPDNFQTTSDSYHTTLADTSGRSDYSHTTLANTSGRTDCSRTTLALTNRREGTVRPGATLPLTNRSEGTVRPGAVVIRRNAEHSGRVEQVRRQTRKVENFRFNPNTVSVDDLMRLGFSEKQAQSIDNYRAKGGRFRRPADFARSYVVADSVFRRLEPFIIIPKLDINRADSAAFEDLPGIGPYFAAKMVSYRSRLGGYSYKEQLMDIYNFDREKSDALSDLISCSRPREPFRLWSLPADSLRLHPYIRDWQSARSIVLFRDNTPREGWTVEALGAAGILSEENARRLSKCYVE